MAFNNCKTKGNQFGATIVEALLPVFYFFILVFLVIDFVLWGWAYVATGYLADEGARWASVQHGTTTLADVRAFVLNRGFLASERLTVTIDPPAGVGGPGTYVIVTVEYAYEALLAGGVLPENILPSTISNTTAAVVRN